MLSAKSNRHAIRDTRWEKCRLLISSLVAYMICDGISLSFGLLFKELLRHFKRSTATTSLAASFLHCVPLLYSPLAHFVLECLKFTNLEAYSASSKRRPSMYLGALVTTLSLASAFFVDDFWLLTFVFGFVLTFGLAIFYMAAITIIPRGFDRNIGVAVGVTVSGSGIGQALFSFMLSKAIEYYGWQGASLLLGGISAHLFACVAFYPPRIVARINQQQRTTEDFVVVRTKSTNVFGVRPCLFYLSSSLFMTGFNIPYVYLADLISEIDTVGLKVSTVRAYVCMGVCMTIGQLLFVLINKSVFVMSHAASFGFLTSGSSVLMFVIAKRISGDRFSLVLGITQFCQGVGIIIGLPVGGLLHDLSHSYFWTFVFASAVLALSALVMAAWPFAAETPTEIDSIIISATTDTTIDHSPINREG
ncbi:hypothetical protein ACOME3_008500 [Neoechinorhynchus agilis]